MPNISPVTLSYNSLFSLPRALNVNKFTGRMPPSLGKLSKLTYLDLADNQLSGHLPISTTDVSGLDQLLKAQHLSVLFV
jgi:Leucine-rich repeat (LRR) protein